MRESDRLVHEFFAAVTAGDLPDDMLTSDMTGWITTGGTMDKQSYQGVIRLLAQMCATPIAFTIDSITAEDDRAVAEAHSECVLVNGEPYNNTYVYVFRFSEGRMIDESVAAAVAH